MGRVVIALGGNAIIRKGDKGDLKTQEKRVREAIAPLKNIIAKNEVVITHGNGPAVGNLLLQQKDSKIKMPLDVLDAETEGQIGYMLQQHLGNVLPNKRVVSLLTQVLVDKKDKAFRRPSKFVGPFYTRLQAEKLKKSFRIKEDKGRGFRRVVASPDPIRVIEFETIEELVKKKTIVIAAGGGGIPVIKKGDKLDGIEAVIDKDKASACLANSISADTLIILTSIDAVYRNFAEENKIRIKEMSVAKAIRLLNEGEFLEGSMGPKIEAAIRFIDNKRKKVIITDPKNLKKALKGKAGTIITNKI